MAIAINDIYRLSMEWVLENQICVNTLHFKATSATATASVITSRLNLLMNRGTLFIAEGLRPAVWHTSVRSERLMVTKVHGPGDPHAGMMDYNFPGARTGELLPGFCAVPIYIQTNFSGRRYTGRFHVGGWVEADQDGGTLTASGMTALATVQAKLEEHFTPGLPFGGAVWEWVVFSRTAAEEGATLIFPSVRAVASRGIMGTVYTRKIGRGQ